MKMQGVVLNGWNISLLVCSPFAEGLVSKIGRKRALILAVVMVIFAALTFCLSTFLKDAWTFWAINLIANLIFGASGNLLHIVPTSIIYSEFPKQANLYYAILNSAWALGYLLGPLISFMAYDTIGHAGMFLLIAGL